MMTAASRTAEQARKNVTRTDACAPRQRISTFIITAQKPPTSIHNRRRVVGAAARRTARTQADDHPAQRF